MEYVTVSTASPRVLKLEGGVELYVPSKTLLAEQLQYIKEVHAAVVRSSRATAIKPVAAPSVKDTAAANVAAAAPNAGLAGIVKTEPLNFDTAEEKGAGESRLTTENVQRLRTSSARALPRQAPEQVDKRMFLQVLEIPPTCSTIDLLVAYFLALQNHSVGCNFQRLVTCCRSVGDLRAALQCVQQALKTQPERYVTRSSGGRLLPCRILCIENVDSLSPIQCDSQDSARHTKLDVDFSNKEYVAHREAIPSTETAMSIKVLDATGDVIRDSHIHTWAACFGRSPAEILEYVARNCAFVIVTQRCLFDFRKVVQQSQCLSQSLLVFDAAHSLLELGKNIFSFDVSVVILEAAINNLEIVRARTIVMQTWETNKFGPKIMRPPQRQWVDSQTQKFPGEIRNVEHFWDFLVSCCSFLKKESEVGVAAVDMASKVGGRSRSSAGASAALSALAQELQDVLDDEMQWQLPSQWIVRLEKKLAIPNIGRIFRRLIDRFEFMVVELRFSAQEITRLMPLLQVCRFLAALEACDMESSKVLVSNSAPPIVSRAYRVQMYAKGSKTSKSTKRLTLTSLAPAPIIRSVLQASQAKSTCLSANDGPLVVICNTALYLPQDLLPTLTLEVGHRHRTLGADLSDEPQNKLTDFAVRTTRLIVESHMQSKIFALNRGDDQEMLDNTLPELQPFRNFGSV